MEFATNHAAIQGATNSNVTAVEKTKLLGEAARTNAANLNWEEYWMTVEGKLPVLKTMNK